MKLYVGNIPRALTEDELREHFQTYGQIASVAILKDKFTGESRGFGFIEMPTKSEADAAITGLHGKPLKGRPLTVNEARPKTDSPHGGGGGSGAPRSDRGDRGDRPPRSGPPPRRSW